MIISVIRTIILYVLIIIAVRVMGKRQISDLQTSELVVTLLISNIASIPMQNTAQPLLSGCIPMLVLVTCEIVISVLMMKNSRFRKIICGKPQIVVQYGKPVQKQLKRLRISTEDLSEQLRQAGVFKMSDVQFAIVETNGKMSVLKDPKCEPPTASDLNKAVVTSDFEVVVVSDGEFAKYSAHLAGVTKQWVEKTLSENKIDLVDVFIMTVTTNQNNYNIITKGE